MGDGGDMYVCMYGNVYVYVVVMIAFQSGLAVSSCTYVRPLRPGIPGAPASPLLPSLPCK